MDDQVSKPEKVFCKHVEPGSGLVMDWDYDVVSRTGDMLLVKRHDGLMGFFPADHFREVRDTDFTSYLNDIMSDLENARRVAEAMDLVSIEERLYKMKVEMNDLSIGLAEVNDGEPD